MKRPKPSTSFGSPEYCQIVIIDRSGLNGSMVSVEWRRMEVESRILLAILETYDASGDWIAFIEAGW